VDLRDIVLEALEEQRLIAPTHQITLVTPARAVVVRADADRVGQVVTNYLANALKYSAPEQPIAVTLRTRSGWAWVSVRDHGPGLARAEQVLVWNRFHRASGVEVRSGSNVGLGLGLYISRDIIQRLGGRVGVRSAPGRGSTFWFTLPLMTDDAT
jgi:signal transduction histidine kinase